MLLITSLRHWRRQDFGKPNWCNTIRFSKSVIEISQRCLLLAKFSLEIETPNGAGSHFRAKLEYSVVLSLVSLGLHCLLEYVCVGSCLLAQPCKRRYFFLYLFHMEGHGYVGFVWLFLPLRWTFALSLEACNSMESWSEDDASNENRKSSQRWLTFLWCVILVVVTCHSAVLDQFWAGKLHFLC